MLALGAIDVQAKELLAGQSLKFDQSLESDNGKYFLVQQSDGNLVVYRKADMKPMWASYTKGTETVMQHDGNLVQYNVVMHNPASATWNSKTSGSAYDPNFKMGVSDNGAAYVKHPNGKLLWNSPPDSSLLASGPCPGGANMSFYPICLNAGSTFQYPSSILACSIADASSRTFYPNTYGACPYVSPF